MGRLPQNGLVSIQPASPMRVLHLIKGLGPGGAERLILNQVATSSNPDIEYAVAFAIREKDHLVDAISKCGVAVTLLDWSRLVPSLNHAIRSHRPDVVHAHSPLLAASARLLRASPVHRFAMVTTEHNRWPRHHRMTRLANRLTAPLDHERIAVSHDVRESMGPRLAEPTRVIDHGIPLDQIASAADARERQRHEILGSRHEDTVAIGIVANFRPEKDYETFLAAARVALDASPRLHLIVVGQGPGEGDFRSKAADIARLHVLGYRADVHEVMSAFDAFTLSSRHEGKPVSLMEAFALGLPAIATRAGGIPEVITDDENGMLVDVGDHEALARSWVQIAEDQALRERLSAGALASRSRFDAASATKSIESLYRSVLERNNDR